MKSYVPSARLEVIETTPSSPIHISSALTFKVDTSGSSLIAKTSLVLILVAGLQPFASVTFIMMMLWEAEVAVRSAAGIVSVPVPPLIVTLATRSFALLGEPKS